ncbi:MAG TPA: hypothetical protein VGR35_08285 [Tepidisphaeraceae bacterium]|nr:hypothetical protein [Tepidisphaeraceae bacterium]
MRKLTLIVAVVLVAVGSFARADIVHLNDGTTLEGKVKKSAQGWIVTDAEGKVTAVPAGTVKSIELKRGAGGGDAPGQEVAERRLYSLRRSVENVSDLRDIVARYQRFVEQNQGTEVGKAAEEELAVWTDRHNRGLVKVGQQWITEEEKAQLLEQTFAVVSEARQLIKDGRLKEADAALVKAMQVDPANPSIQYLRGVVKYRQNEVPAARKAFELVIDQITNHAPSLNNLAVILARQNHPAASLGMYDRAMQAQEQNRHILDNVAEAFYALSPSERKAPIVQRAVKRFLEQDEQLQQEMAKKGQYRWGSTWVNQQQLDELKVAEEGIKGRLDQLAAEFDAAQARINTIRQDIAANTNTMRQLEARRHGYGAGGNLVSGTLPARYYDLQADNARLEEEQKQQVQKMQQLRAAAKEVEKQLPTPRYSGVQKLIETEGTPIEAPEVEFEGDAATTQPAAAQGTGSGGSSNLQIPNSKPASGENEEGIE